MSRRFLILISFAILVTAMSVSVIHSASKDGSSKLGDVISAMSTIPPNIMCCSHDVGNVWCTVANNGLVASRCDDECESGLSTPRFEFPAGSGVEYSYGAAIWIGAIVPGDTLVSVGADGWQLVNELYPCGDPDCGIVKLSIDPASPHYSPDAISDLDMIAEYTDTLTDPAYVHPDFDGQPYTPLNIDVVQTSHSWAAPGLNEFIIIEYEVSTLGAAIQDAYLGMFVDGDVYQEVQSAGWSDDVSGHRSFHPPELNGDSISCAWVADNDGDPNGGVFDMYSATGVMGVAFLGPIASSMESFNWWQSNGGAALDWGPWTESNSFFDFHTGGIGTPEGNSSQYFMLSNGEIDYDQYTAAVDHSFDGWLPPAAVSLPIASGCDARFLLSYGPVDISPGNPVRFAIVFSGGHDFHVGADDYMNLFDPYDPGPFEATLDFSSLEENLTAARLKYDEIHMGDINWDGDVDIEDAIALIGYVYLGGDEPAYMPVTDLNCDGKRDLLDIIVLVNYIFRGGPLPGAGC